MDGDAVSCVLNFEIDERMTSECILGVDYFARILPKYHKHMFEVI